MMAEIVNAMAFPDYARQPRSATLARELVGGDGAANGGSQLPGYGGDIVQYGR